MSKIIGVTSILVILFYHIYPQALSLFGYSFLFTPGLIGIALYFLHKSPFREVVGVALAYATIIICGLISLYINNEYSDTYVWDLSRSQVAWFFSAYFIIFLFFKVHPEGSVKYLMYYIVAAVTLQGIISIAMYMDPEIYDFFDSIHTVDPLAAERRAESRGTRLLGYGTAFFGAGIINGVVLVILGYLIVAKRKSTLEVVLFSIIYAFIFFVGLLSARTTMIGLGASVLLMIGVLIFSKEKNTKQFFIFFLLALVSITVLQTIAYTFFPDFANWAFEAFINYSETGELRTQSSDSLSNMFLLPEDLQTWLFGKGSMAFWGSDVGFTRLLFYSGLFGTFAFFFYQMVLIKYSFTKDRALNLTLVCLFFYNLALNYKGLSDVNGFLCLFFFYFMYYKYYVYMPKMYVLDKQRRHLAKQMSEK